MQLTGLPSSLPTDQLTKQPTSFPTSPPPDHPTGQPSSFPTDQPRGQPTTQSTSVPTSQTTEQPTGQPSSLTADQPQDPPTSQLAIQPTSLPTPQPTNQPTRQCSSSSTEQPTDQPTGLTTSNTSGGGQPFLYCPPLTLLFVPAVCARSLSVHSPVRRRPCRDVLVTLPVSSVHYINQPCREVLVTLPVNSVQNNNCREVPVTPSVSSVHTINSNQYSSPISTSSSSTRPRHLDSLHQITDACSQAGWPTLHVLLLDRLYAVFSVLLFLHDCLSYVPTLLGNGRQQHHRHCDPPRRSIDSTVLYAACLLCVSTALEYDKRIAYS